MNALLIWILVAAFTIPILLAFFHFWYMNMHKYVFHQYIWDAGVKRLISQRYRMKGGLFYKPFRKKPGAMYGIYSRFFAKTVTPFYSYFPGWEHKSVLFFRREKETLYVDYEDISEYLVPVEAGFGSPKNILRLNEQMMPWRVSTMEKSNIINNDMVVKINELREEIYESTKNPLTTQELLSRVLIPMGLILLALACLIFFPKIYSTIQQASIAQFGATKQSILDLINQNRPVG